MVIKGTVVDVEYHLIKLRTLWIMQEDGTTIQVRLTRKMNQTLPPNIYGAEVQGEAYEYRPSRYTSNWLAIREPEVDSLLAADRCICIVDSNEAAMNPETIAELRAWNIDIAVSPLTGTGSDFVPSGRIGIQRKTYSDLAGSIANGRLFGEMEELESSYEIPILMIEGLSPDNCPYCGAFLTNSNKTCPRCAKEVKRTHMTPESVEGSLAYLARTIPQIRIVNRPNRHSAALFLRSIVYGEQTDRRHMPSLKQWKRAEDLNLARLATVQQWPGFGPRKSRRLLREKKRLDEIAQLSEMDLRKYTHRSKETAKVLHEPFEENKT